MRRRAAVVLTAGAFVLAGLIAAGVAGFPREGVPARGSSRPVELPGQLQAQVYQACIPGADLKTVHASSLALSITGSGPQLEVGIQDSANWEVTVGPAGDGIRMENGGAQDDGSLAVATRALAVAHEFYDCLAPYRFESEGPATYSGSQLLQLYKYETAVLWPCLAGLGYHVGKPPTRQDFADSVRATTVNPFGSADLRAADLRLLAGAVEQCPMEPAYLG